MGGVRSVQRAEHGVELGRVEEAPLPRVERLKDDPNLPLVRAFRARSAVRKHACVDRVTPILAPTRPDDMRKREPTV